MPKPLKAYEDVAFLKQDVCRPVRLQLELLKPESVMADHGIRSTIVLFGSARIPSPEQAQQRLQEAQTQLAEKPDCPQRQFQLRAARRIAQQSRYYTVAREFAALASSKSEGNEYCHYVIMTGGGGGIMEAGNRGAADVGAQSIGLNISLPYEQEPNRYISPDLSFHFHYFSIRKMHFLLRARAMCAFPGGFGTMDELFETLTLIQTGKISPIPVVLFGREFWEEFVNWQVLVERGMISPEDIEIFRYCETAREAWEYILEFWQDRDGVAWRSRTNITD